MKTATKKRPARREKEETPREGTPDLFEGKEGAQGEEEQKDPARPGGPEADISKKEREALRKFVGPLSFPQARAYERLGRAVLSKKKGVMRSLKGYAGTGKTYLAGRLSQALRAAGRDVKVAAPTHKATQQVAREVGETLDQEEHASSSSGGEAEARTIQSLLGLKLVPDGKGGFELEPDKYKGPKIFPEDVVIVDESSMIGEQLWKHVCSGRGRAANWVFVGDPAQLPPVNEGASPALSLGGETLEEIVRQARGNPIIELATEVRMGRDHRRGELFEFDASREEGIAATSSRGALVESALRAFGSEDFAEDGDHARILAYRNDTVDYYNRVCREAIYGSDAPEYVEGEHLVADVTWGEGEGGFGSRPLVYNSETLRVIEAEETISACPDGIPPEARGSRRGGSAYRIWKLKVDPIGEGRSKETIVVMSETDQAAFDKAVEAAKREALDIQNAGGDASGAWKRYYDLKQKYAKVSPAFSTTIHKAQGSTFDSVFLDARDVRACRSEGERQALLYVGVTRPSRRLAYFE